MRKSPGFTTSAEQYFAFLKMRQTVLNAYIGKDITDALSSQIAEELVIAGIAAAAGMQYEQVQELNIKEYIALKTRHEKDGIELISMQPQDVKKGKTGAFFYYPLEDLKMSRAGDMMRFGANGQLDMVLAIWAQTEEVEPYDPELVDSRLKIIQKEMPAQMACNLCNFFIEGARKLRDTFPQFSAPHPLDIQKVAL